MIQKSAKRFSDQIMRQLKSGRWFSGQLQPAHPSSLPGLTRQSILFEGMDHRVTRMARPGDDESQAL